MKKITHRSSCPISFSLDLFGDKWSLLIIRDMMLYNKFTYGEFLQSPERISTNILAVRLAALEHNGFITRRVSTEKKNKIIYGMTEKAIDLIPILMEYILWGTKHNPSGNEELRSELNNDKQQTILKYENKIRNSLNLKHQ